MELPASMPGSFLSDFDHPVQPALTKANAKPSLFLPPTNQSASSSLSFHCAQGTVSGSSTGSRKRARYEAPSVSALTTPCQVSQYDWCGRNDSTSSTPFSPTPSPAPFVSTKYRLAGGRETSSNVLGASFNEEEALESELDYRPGRFLDNPQRDPDGYFPRRAPLTSREVVGRKRAWSSSETAGWRDAVYKIVGGMINFCWNNPFRGFHAGTGRGYRMDIPQPATAQQRGRVEAKGTGHTSIANQQRRGMGSRHSSEGDIIEDNMSHSYADEVIAALTPTRFNLDGSDEKSSSLRDNWVLVKDYNWSNEAESPASAARKLHRSSIITQHGPVSGSSWSRRPRLAPSRPSYAGSPGLESTRPASYAPTRALTRKPASPKRPRSCESTPLLQSPQKRAGDRNSLSTSTRSPEVQKFEKRVRRKERAQEESMQRLNQQLQDMIRAGKQALGTRVGIEDDADTTDEGYGEGTEAMGYGKW